jgi:hypothetical protein
MITPQPESDLSMNVMVVGSDIIKILKKAKDYSIIEDLLTKFLKLDKRRTPELFFDAITFLFTIGIITEDKYKVRLKNAQTQKTLL